ncbi:MAG: rhomboid family intramembrane serine protease [Candidatus Halalkalibacterium sp. M3_1C_030]
MVIFGAIALISGLTQPSSNVANFAHLGGMLFGYALIKFWGLKGEEYYR